MVIGMAAHVVRVDENMSVDVDQPRSDEAAFGGDGAERFAGRERWRDGRDLAAGDADVHDAAKPGRRIQNVAAGQNKVVFHAPVSTLISFRAMVVRGPGFGKPPDVSVLKHSREAQSG
jgi:hypothetical protein